MVKQIRVYIEGAPQLREGFRVFLQSLYDAAKNNRIKIEPPKLCGSRGDAYKAFKAAIKTHPDSFIVLLVDSEGPVARTPWAYVKNRTEEGPYNKTRHASQLLARLNVDRVRKAAPHCDRLFSTLVRIMEAS